MYHRTIVSREMRQEVDAIVKKVLGDDGSLFKRNVVFVGDRFLLSGDLPLVVVYRSNQLEGFKERIGENVAFAK